MSENDVCAGVNDILDDLRKLCDEWRDNVYTADRFGDGSRVAHESCADELDELIDHYSTDSDREGRE